MQQTATRYCFCKKYLRCGILFTFPKFTVERSQEWHSRIFLECRYRGDSLKCRRPRNDV